MRKLHWRCDHRDFSDLCSVRVFFWLLPLALLPWVLLRVFFDRTCLVPNVSIIERVHSALFIRWKCVAESRRSFSIIGKLLMLRVLSSTFIWKLCFSVLRIQGYELLGLNLRRWLYEVFFLRDRVEGRTWSELSGTRIASQCVRWWHR